MAQENLIYPVGMFYAASNAPQEEHQPEILGNAMKPPGSSQIEENDANPEDRSSDDYWEKRKRFTLAFAAGLRKFIQMHPELLRYGPKKNQGGISATVTSSVAAEDGEALAEGEEAQCGRCVACLKTDDCGKCAFCSDMSKFGGKNELKKRCIRRQCLQAPMKNVVSAVTNFNHQNETPENSIEGTPGRPVRVRAGVNNDSDFLFPVKEEYLDDDDDDLLPRSGKRTRNSSPRAKRTRKQSRRSRNDDDVDYKPSQRSRRTKQSQNVGEVTPIISLIKTEDIIDAA